MGQGYRFLPITNSHVSFSRDCIFILPKKAIKRGIINFIIKLVLQLAINMALQ